MTRRLAPLARNAASASALVVVLGAAFAAESSGERGACGSPDMVFVRGGRFEMGAGAVYPEETPSVSTRVDGFCMSRFETTNAQFAEFVSATGYVTVAERPNADGGAGAGSVLFRPRLDSAARSPTAWWRFTAGASWRHPGGPGSTTNGQDRLPVVHVALEDAEEYARWRGHRLPTEAEFEYASRGGIDGARFEWGRSLLRDGEHVANTWQGPFPHLNSGEDGFEGLAPVGSYPANRYGLHDLIGNVWEWTRTTYYPRHTEAGDPRSSTPPGGFDPNQPGVAVGVLKGGSFLCGESFCGRFRPAARHAQDVGLGASHIGFRTVRDVER